jgi:hypothetical protein
MGYRVLHIQDQYGARKGLEGPFRYANGRVLYYDPKEGRYWDPKTDFYVEHNEVTDLEGLLFDLIKGRPASSSTA